MQAEKEHNDLEALEQKARYDDVQKQRMKLEELSASHKEMQAAFWSSDVSRRAYKAALVQDANIQMSTQQYVQKSDDAFHQLLTVHKETIAKAQEIQSDSYAKDELVTRLRTQMRESELNHTRQEGLLIVYQDRVNNSVAKTIYDAVEHDLTQKNLKLIKLEEQSVKLNAKIAALEVELQFKSQKGRKDDMKSLGTAQLMKDLAQYKQQAKAPPIINTKGQIVVQTERESGGGDAQDDVVIPNFFVDGLSRRPGRVGTLECALHDACHVVTTPRRSDGYDAQKRPGSAGRATVLDSTHQPMHHQHGLARARSQRSGQAITVRARAFGVANHACTLRPAHQLLPAERIRKKNLKSNK